VRRLWSEVVGNVKHLRYQIAGRGYWRMGCGRCEQRADFATREQAEKAARIHDERAHEGRETAKVYVPTWLRRFVDSVNDQG